MYELPSVLPLCVLLIGLVKDLLSRCVIVLTSICKLLLSVFSYGLLCEFLYECV